MLGLHERFPVCMVQPKHEDMYSLLYLIEVVIYRIIPVILIAVFNAFIIIRVVNAPKIRRNRRANHSNEEDKNRQLTITLILVSTVYVITYLPVLIHHLLWKLIRLQKIDIDMRHMDIAQNLGNSLYILGFSSNFFLYNLSSGMFRNQLTNIITFWKK